MFTGLIDHLGEIVGIERLTASALRLVITSQFHDLQLGESIAINGICLTVMQIQANTFTVEVSPETCAVTNIAQYRLHDKVNLERALRFSDRLGGHILTGHVDTVAYVKLQMKHAEFVEIEFAGLRDHNTAALIHKGCIAINGVSLTVNAVTADGFRVMLVPHTLQITNLAALALGDVVNVEYDWLTKIIQQQVQQRLALLEVAS